MPDKPASFMDPPFDVRDLCAWCKLFYHTYLLSEAFAEGGFVGSRPCAVVVEAIAKARFARRIAFFSRWGVWRLELAASLPCCSIWVHELLERKDRSPKGKAGTTVLSAVFYDR